MAYTKLIFIAALIAVASAGFVWQDDDNDFPPFPSAPKMWPFMPPMVNPFPQGFPFHNIPPIKFPSPDDIKNTKPREGQTYSGVFVSSNDGEGSLVANVNGEVFEKKNGAIKKVEKTKPANPSTGVYFTPPFLYPFYPSFPFFGFQYLTPNAIKNTKPLPGQSFNGVFVSSDSDEGTKIITNINGEVTEKKIPPRFQRQPVPNQPEEPKPAQGPNEDVEPSPPQGPNELIEPSPSQGPNELIEPSPPQGPNELIEPTPPQGPNAPERLNEIMGSNEPKEPNPPQGTDEPTGSSEPGSNSSEPQDQNQFLDPNQS